MDKFQFHHNDSSKLELLISHLKQTLFFFMYAILKSETSSLWTEFLSIIIEMFQFTSFSFHLSFFSTWKQPHTYEQISYFFSFFLIVPFFEDNKPIYIITFYLICILIGILIIYLIYYSIKFNSKSHSSTKFILTSLFLILKGVNSFLYIPILYLFCSIFACIKENDIPCFDGHRNTNEIRNLKVNYIVKTITCFNGFYYLHFVFGVLFAILFFVLNVCLTNTFYSIKLNTSSPSSKIINDIEKKSLYYKSLLCLLFCIFGTHHNSWILTFVIVYCACSLLYLQYYKHPDNNDVVHKSKIFSYGIFAWSTFVLLIGHILKNTNFNGCIGLFFIGIPVIFFTVISSKTFPNEIQSDFNSNNNIYSMINNFRLLIRLIKQKDTNRRANVLLKGYVFEYETTCPIKKCPLKLYLECKTKKEDNNAFLLQHVDVLFIRAKAKYPSNILIKILYAIFISEYLNKKQQAIIEIEECELNQMTFDEEFQCYRLRRQLEEQTMDTGDQNIKSDSANKSEYKIQNRRVNGYSALDIASNIAYKKYFTTFKSLINKASLLYIDFWNMLLNPNQDSKQLSKLNEYGTKITASVEEIKEIFNKIQKVKFNDKQTITYYSDFLSNILNDKEQAFQLKKLIKSKELKQPYDEKNYFNLDLAALASSDEYQYIIVSGKLEKLGVVIHISLGVCLLLGYNRNELIGKSYELFMPQIFHKEHKQMLINKVSEFKKDSINYNSGNNDNNDYRSIFKDIYCLAKTRARYLIPILMKIILINTENIGPTFIVKVFNESFIKGSNLEKDKKKSSTPLSQSMILMKNNINKYFDSNNQICVILTNNSFIIQNFTANAIALLGINSNYMNSSIDICSFIKQFHEELLKYITDNEATLTSEEKNALKRQIALTRFKTPTLIEWKVNDGEQFKFKGTKIENRESKLANYNDDDLETPANRKKSKRSIYSNITHQNFLSNYINITFYLTVHEATMGNKQEGYIFKFEQAFINEDIVDSKFSSRDASSKKLPMPTIQGVSAYPKHASKFQTVKVFPSFKQVRKIGKLGVFSSSNIETYHDDSSIKISQHKEQNETRAIIKSDQNVETFGNNNYPSPCGKYSSNLSFLNANFDLYKNYVPVDKTFFQFDANKISYLLNPQNSEDIKEVIKQKAFDKLKEEVGYEIYQDIENDNDGEEEEEEEEDDNENEENEAEENEDNEERSSSLAQSSNVHNSIISSKLQSKKEHNKHLLTYQSFGVGTIGSSNILASFKNSQDVFGVFGESYYKVCMDKIKYSIYDYKRRVLIERPYEKISQVDFKKREYHHKKGTNIFDNPLGKNDVHSQNESLGHKNRNSVYLPENAILANQDNNLLFKDRKMILMKQIEYSLSKQDTHKVLTSFQIFGLIFFITVISFIIGFSFTFTKTKSLLDENFNIIKSNYNIISKTLNSLACIRELILLSTPKYDAFLTNKENDLTRLTTSLDKYYIQMHEDILNIIVTSLPLAETEYNSLNVDLIDISILKDDSTLNVIKMPITSAFLEVNTAIFHILKNNSTKTFNPLESYIFFYIDNLNNNLFMELQKTIVMFSKELKQNHYFMIYNIIYIECGFFVFLLSSMFVANYLFNKILQIKASYLEVFLEISKNVIRSSLERCENFTKKLQDDSLSEFISTSDDDNSINNDLSPIQGNTNANSKMVNDNDGSNIKSGNHFHKRNKKRRTQNVFVKISFLIFVCFIFVVSVMFEVFFGMALVHVENNIYCFSRNKEMEIHFLKLYNYIRDYIFDSNFHVEGYQIQDTINSFFKYFYGNISQYEKQITKYLVETPKDFQERYFQLYHNDLCALLNKSNDKECLQMGSTSTQFGLQVMLSNFFEEILVLKSKKKALVIQNNNRFHYNLTLSGTDYEKEYISKLPEEEIEDYYKGHPIELYNTNEHKTIKKMYMNYIVGAFEFLNKMMISSIENYFKEKNILFLVMWIVFGIFVLFMYFSVWLPVQLQFGNVIFKTKNMLRIIPKEVLVNVPNISYLLGIQQHMNKREGGLNKKK